MPIDISKLINEILSTSKSANFNVDETNENSDFKAEPILKRGSEINAPISPKYEQLFAIYPTKNTNFWEPAYHSEQFYLQAKFMENFEDNFPSFIHSYRYMPKYVDFTTTELRAYFTWRSKVRDKIVVKNSLSFVYLYIYELLNGFGIKNVLDGLDKILYIWTQYRVIDDKIDTYLSSWIKDYYVLNLSEKLTYKELLSRLPTISEDNELILDELICNNFKNKLSFFNKYSSYKIINSRFFSDETSPILENCFMYVLTAIKSYFDGYNIDFQNLFIGKVTGYYQISFYRNAIFYDTNTYSDKEVFLTNSQSYICKNGVWKSKSVSVQAFLSKNIIGYVLKCMEMRIRQHKNYKYKLSLNTSTMANECFNRNFIDNYSSTEFFKLLADKDFTDIINNAVDLCFRENNYNSCLLPKAPPPPKEIIIDSKKFDEIRSISKTIQKKLIIDEPKQEETVVIPKIISKEMSQNNFGNTAFAKSLNDEEITVIKFLLNGDYTSLQKNTTTMIEVLTENINEKALEFLNDNILDNMQDKIVIYDDYIDDLKELEIFK